MVAADQAIRANSLLSSIGTAECRRWSDGIFKKHQPIDGYLKAFYLQNAHEYGHVRANQELRKISKRLMWDGFSCSVTSDDDSIHNLAEATARQCDKIFNRWASVADIHTIKSHLVAYCQRRGFDFPCNVNPSDSEESVCNKVLAGIARICDDRWWVRKIRKAFNRRIETILLDLGAVNSKTKNSYISKFLLSRFIGQQSRNQKVINSLDCVRNDGLVVSMADCVSASVANPVNRRNELMVRVRGYEEIATGLGLSGVMLTLTCPSRFHAFLSVGRKNPKYQGKTPADGMEWLNKTWQRIRSKWARKGIKPFGFRVTEPQHDATPHFHILLFVENSNLDLLIDIFKEKALEDTPNEPGAKKHRCDVLRIDPAKGSAAGYIAKYIAKNIDGFSNDYDYEAGCNGEEGALRVRAWASLWNIRQFQQIGCVSVTVWRELRRKVDCEKENPELLNKLRGAADSGNWALFVELMGGPTVKQNEQALRPHREESDIPNRYGERVEKLIGVTLQRVSSRVFVTRDHTWVVEHKARVIEENPVRYELEEESFLRRAPPVDLDLCQ